MCGIVGFVDTKNIWNKEILLSATSSLIHRGPDAFGLYYNAEKGIGLGHRRLSIIDLSDKANQPMYSHDNRYIMVYNGEVYNYREIADKFFKNINLITTSDSEVILELFALKGPSFVHELNGIFSIAIYDSLLDELYIFRDRVGVKPLVYYYDNVNFIFSSELKAILKFNISKEINFTSLQDYLFLEYVPADQTIFKQIKKLPAGHYMKITKNDFNIYCYYDILDKINNSNYGKSITQIESEFKELLFSSVSMQTISDVPLGAFLSGGTDSSIICAAFQAQNNIPVNTFTIGFNVPEFDESFYACKVAEILHTNHHLTMSYDKEAIAFIDNLTDAYDEPFATPSTLPSMLVCSKAKKYVTVAMSGDGGDELFMGYGYYKWYDRLSKIHKIGGSLSFKIVTALLNSMGNKYKRASRVFDYPDFASIWLHLWSQEQYMFNEKEISILLNKHYQHQTLSNEWYKINNMPIHPFEKISLFDLKNYLSNNLLYKMDIASMYSSLEVRVPLLDHRLIEYVINLPLQYKINKKEQKFLLKKILEQFLPKELIYRKKWGFPAPLHKWLQTDLAFLIDKYLNNELLKKQSIFNYKFVENLICKFKKGEEFHYKRIWALIFFQLWYEKYIDETKS